MNRQEFDALLKRRDEKQREHELACAVLEEHGHPLNHRRCAPPATPDPDPDRTRRPMADRMRIKIEDFEAEDVRAFYDSEVFRVWHLGDKERTYRILRVQRITEEFRGETKRRALLWLQDSRGREVPLPLVLNPTNRNTVMQLYGKRARKDWPGKLITLYPTTTEVGGEIRDCIRVRNYVPGTRTRTNKQGANVLPPGVRDSDDAAYTARDNQRAEQEEIGAPRVPPSQPAPLDHERATRNEHGDDDTMEAEYEVIQ